MLDIAELLVIFQFIFLVMLKSLCGYEYISVIMMGSILFLIVDFIVAVTQRIRNSQN